MIIAGIDPGTQRTGYAIIEAVAGGVEIREIGCWDFMTGAKTRPSLGHRLEQLSDNMRVLFKAWNPQVIGFEKAVTFKNMASALTLSEARGVIRLAAYEILESADARIFELSPTAIKKEASGSGQSSKQGVRKGLALRFRNLESFVADADLPADAFDALGIAWTAWILRGRYQRHSPRVSETEGSL